MDIELVKSVRLRTKKKLGAFKTHLNKILILIQLQADIFLSVFDNFKRICRGIC